MDGDFPEARELNEELRRLCGALLTRSIRSTTCDAQRLYRAMSSPRDLLKASSVVLLALTVALLALTVALLALPSIFNEQSCAVFGTLWLTVTVITGLVLEVEARPKTPADLRDDPTSLDTFAP
jgi:hypothetical protein